MYYKLLARLFGNKLTWQRFQQTLWLPTKTSIAVPKSSIKGTKTSDIVSDSMQTIVSDKTRKKCDEITDLKWNDKQKKIPL